MPSETGVGVTDVAAAARPSTRRWVTVARVALAYVLRHPLPVFAIIGCTTEAKLADDVGATSLELDEATLRWLDGNASPR